MPDGLLGVIGLVVGLVVGWYWASSRSRPGMVKQLAETKVRGARAVEHLKQEVAAELDRRERELADLRTTYEQARQAAASTEAKLQADITRARDEKTQLFASLGGELHTVVDESFREVAQLYEVVSSLEHAVQAIESRLLAASKRMKELGVAGGPSVAPTELPGPTEVPAPVPQPVSELPAVGQARIRPGIRRS